MTAGAAETGPRVVLVGPPGAGKSTVGRLVAEALGVRLADTDAIVEQRAGTSVSDIFISDGEERFRELEQAAVAHALRTHPGVLALGGGAVLAEPTRTALDGHLVVFLTVSAAAAAPRVGLSVARPLLMGSPRKQWRELMAAREHLYEQVATFTVETDGLTPEQVAEIVLAELAVREAR